MKLSKKVKFTVIVLLLISMSISFIYTLDKAIMPRVMLTCDATMRGEVTKIINETIFEEYSRNFNYDDLIHMEKDSEGNITMMKADTLKLSEISAVTVMKAQKKIEEKSSINVKIPLGQITRTNLLGNLGPNIKVKMGTIGNITSRYISEFESAGINQTRHKIYIETTTRMRLILPFESSELEVVNQIPVVETIIVGKVPATSVQLDLNN